MGRSRPSSARPKWKPPWESQVKENPKKKTVSFQDKPHSKIPDRNHGSKPSSYTGGPSSENNEIVVDWSSGKAKLNINRDTFRPANRVLGKGRAELQAQKQADDLLGKSTFTPPASQSPPLESVRIGNYQSTECK